ncbi:unnamed protein product [Moneuplotes crassus]|uniref:Uncharacterized protein n=1 Tax=Euplotes crassus TaxID=5936 RepID=A0AAD1Y9R8_EUPCR|nr:unnamed protein product [Moneuplotes crassus]
MVKSSKKTVVRKGSKLYIPKVIEDSHLRRLGSPAIISLKLKSDKALKQLKLKKDSNNLFQKICSKNNHFRVKSRAIKNMHKVDLSNRRNKKAVSRKIKAKLKTFSKDDRILEKCELVHKNLLQRLSIKMELSKYCNERFFSPQRLQRKLMSPINIDRAFRNPKAHKSEATKYLPELSIQSI